MKRIVILFVILLSCKPQRSTIPPDSDLRIKAAAEFTERFSKSPLAAWHIHGSATGPDCTILFIETSTVLEDSMIEAMHYGQGAYGVYRGGVQNFIQQRRFRGVAYKDASGRVWAYGVLNAAEVDWLPRCQ